MSYSTKEFGWTYPPIEEPGQRVVDLVNVCPICKGESDGADFCNWCRSEASTFLRTFTLYTNEDREDIYELLSEEADKLSMTEHKLKRKGTNMVDVASKILGY